MDSITQAALGAAIGEKLLGEKLGNKGAFLGAIIATIPDLDFLLLPFYSDLERISIHRGYSHSILFSIVGAILLTIVLNRTTLLKNIPIRRLLLFNWLALFTHMLLDAFTTYGTQLLLPFSDYRVGFDSINIVDPLYTLPLLIGLLFSLWIYRDSAYRQKWNNLGLIVSSLYLFGTLGIKSYVINQFEEELALQKIEYNSLLTVPVALGSVNWYGVALTDKGLYMGKYSNFKDNKISFDYFMTNDSLLSEVDTELANRMKWFAKGHYVVAKSQGKIRFYNLQCDMQGIRYFEGEKMPTAFYFEITPYPNGSFDLNVGVHPE